MEYLHDNIGSFKKLRHYLGLEEARTCAACSLGHVCKLKDRVPEQRVASTKDVYTVMYFMVKHAQYSLYQQTAQQTGQQDPTELHGPKLTDEQLLKEEAERQLGVQEKVGEEPPMDPSEEFKLYLAGIRVLDNLRQIRADSEETREELAELIEQNVKEYTVKKQVDYILDDTNLLKESSMGEKRKRMEEKGMHELVAVSRQKMDRFARERGAKADTRDKH
jgi:predicted nucleotidyltransferase